MLSNVEVVLKSGKKVILRLIEEGDVEGIWANFNEVVEERIYLPTFSPVLTEWERNSWYRDLDLNDNFCIVAIDPDQPYPAAVVGQCTIENLEWEAAEHVGLLGIIIQKGFRNQGLGQAVIEYAKQEAKKRGKEKIILTTFATNAMGLQLYKRCGFREAGRYTKQYKIDNKYIDEVLMECWLD
jgi:RimJ/RimL family protein N-acetyltransferase